MGFPALLWLFGGEEKAGLPVMTGASGDEKGCGTQQLP